MPARNLRARPGFALASILSLALGIGACVAISIGAQCHNVLGLVLRRGMTLTLCGIALGLAGSYVLTRLMTSMLFGVTAHDAVTFAGVSLLLAMVAMVACLVPARRATKVDPLVALHYE